MVIHPTNTYSVSTLCCLLSGTPYPSVPGLWRQGDQASNSACNCVLEANALPQSNNLRSDSISRKLDAASTGHEDRACSRSGDEAQDTLGLSQFVIISVQDFP